MKTNNTPNGGVSSYGKLLSLFGRKLKNKGDAPDAGTGKAAEANAMACTFARGRRILIADDDPVFAKATENKLRAHGFVVSTVLEGSSVLKAAREAEPDVILLDIEFPPELPTSWDGFTIMEWLNQMNWFSNTPIVICTGRNDATLEDRAKPMRASAVFHKPLDYAALLGLLEFKLTQARSSANKLAINN